MTIREFIDKNAIAMTSEWADRNPNADDWGSNHLVSHWRVTLKRGRRRLTTFFSMGSAHIGEPDIKDVLDSLASDATSFENADSFEEWAREFGYSEDSRKAERTYKAVEKNTRKLRSLLGWSGLEAGSPYDELLWNTERE